MVPLVSLSIVFYYTIWCNSNFIRVHMTPIVRYEHPSYGLPNLGGLGDVSGAIGFPPIVFY